MSRILAVACFALGAFSACGPSTDPEALRSAQGEAARLKQELAARDQEVKTLRHAVETHGDPEKLRAKLAEAEKARDKAQADHALAQAIVQELRERVAAGEAQAARPAPPAPSEPRLSEIVEKCSPSVVMIKTPYGVGAGFFLGPGGFIATNYHVIAGATQIEVVTFVDFGKERPARAIAIDLTNDLALLRLNSGEAVAGLELESTTAARVGDDVFTIGNPGVGEVVLAQSVSSGIISNLARELEGATYLQTTTPINPGNSGGPLINRAGRVVGVVTAKGVGVENIGFAIPGSRLRDLFAGKDGDFAVKTSLAEWEREKGFKRAKPPVAGIAVNARLTQLFVDEALDRLIGLNAEGNGVLLLSLSKKEVVGSLFTGLQPSFMVPDRDPRIYWVSHQGVSHLAKVDVVDGKVLEQVKLERSMYRFLPTPDRFWEYGQAGLRVFAAQGGRSWQCDVHMSALAFDRKRNRLIALDHSNTLSESSPDTIFTLVRQYHEANGARSSKPKDLMQITEEIRKRFKPLATVPRHTGGFQWNSILVNEKAARLYVNRTVIDLAKPESILGSLAASPYSREDEPGIRRFLQRRPLLQLIQASSPDGKWVATGTHLFNGVNFAIQKELPIPCEAVAFSADSKTLYYFDFLNRQIVPLPVE